ncbi:MAG: M3 family oligoendopeptidase [Ilumatobacteraceae bacterium]|nr:M3 family oligoendopeptidase [Ilumatobacteraceae bacterium]
MSDTTLPRWSVADVHDSLSSRSFTDDMENLASDVSRLESLFEHHNVRDVNRDVTDADGPAADEIIVAVNRVLAHSEILEAYVYATVTTNSRDEQAQGLLSEVEVLDSRVRPLLARLAQWIGSLGIDALSAKSTQAHEHYGPLLRLAQRAAHQMPEAQEGLYAELATTGSGAWGRLQGDITSQLSTTVAFPDGSEREMPMPAIRGLASHADEATRRAGYEAEMNAWPRVAVVCAAAMNSIKGEANTVNAKRHWESPLEASLYGNSVSRPTFDAMQKAVTDSLPDFRQWMKTKSSLHASGESLPWWNMMAPLPVGADNISWDEGIASVRNAFGTYSPELAALVDRSINEKWLDAEPRDGKVGGAFCMPFVGDRSLVLLNWTGSADSAQTTAHELGHAYHNTQLSQRTPLQKRLPMALAETASIFCETLMVEAGLASLQGNDRLALLDVDLVGSTQVVVDIHSRFLFETEVFARRQRRTLGVSELNELMTDAQAAAYGDGLDQSTAHPHMWVLKPHYYGSHFYNWPYTYGLLFGLGLFSQFQADPDKFRHGYDTLLSRAGMDTAEELGAAFGFDVTGEAFWTASLDVVRTRIADYNTHARSALGS